nr:MAG TPA: DnaB-like helicase [Bacteriophage sp.]
MTALEAFNALNNREVSRKEVEQILTQAKAENNTAIIYRLSQALNNSPEATHFEITITQYDSSAGLSGVQHTGDYREALDDCGRLRKGWKFVKGNVVKVEEKPKKEAKPKKEKAPQKETKKDKKYKFVVITDDRPSRVIAVFSYTNPNIEGLREIFWKNGEGKYYETTEEGLRNYAFGMGAYPFEKTKKHIEEKYIEGKDFIYFSIEEDGGRNKAISLVEKPKKEAKPEKEKAPKKEETTKEVSGPKVKDFEAFDDLQAQLLAENADIPKSEVLDFLYNFTDAFEEGKTVFRFWNTPGKKPTEAVLQYKKHPLLTRLQNPSAKMRAYELTPRGYELLEKFHKGVERIKKTYDLGYIAGIHKLSNFLEDRKAYVKKEEAKGKETSDSLTKFREQAKEFHQKEKAPNSLKFSDIDNNRTLIESFTDKNTGTSRLFVKDSLGLTFSFSPLEKFMAVEQISALYGKDRKEEAEKDYSRMKEEIAWAFNHHVSTAQRKGTLEVCEKYFLENLPELLTKGGLWLEAKAKNKGAAAAKSSLTKLRRQVWEDIGALAVGESTENVQDSSKKKVEKASDKATKSLKSKEEKGENVANFTLLQEPTKVFLEFEDEKNETYYKKSADKQGAVGSDFLKKILKDLKKQNLKEEPRGFINTEDFLVKPTISKITGIDSLKTIVAKDDLRPTLECVLIEANRYVATDAHNIILLNRPKNDGMKTGALYDPNYKCTKMGGCSKQEYYRDIERGYPNYKAVLTENPIYTSDWVAIEPIIQHLKSGLEVIRKIYDWKMVYVVKITSNAGEGHYRIKDLLNILQILQSNGAKKIRLYTNNLENKNLNIETDNGNIALTTPVYMWDRSNDVISQLRIAPIQLHFTQNRKEEKGLSSVDYSKGLFGAVPEVSTERFKQMSVPELREYTLEYYLENYGGKSISKNFFKEDNIQIEFFNTAGKKLQKPIYKEKVAVLEHLESLIKNSTYNNWGNRKESSPPNIIGYLNFKAKVTIDGEKRHVRISIAVDRDRKFRFKTLEVGANPKKKKQATSIPAPWVTESLRDSSLSEDKVTKKSLFHKKKDENFGLNAPEAPITSLPAPRQTLAQQLAKSPEVRESFLVADEQMSLFLGALEKKTKDSLVITLTGKQGSGKTRFAFQFMNALAQRYRVGHASIEEHPESVLYEEKAYQYLNDTALEHITAQDVRSLAELDTMIHTNEVIVIDSFQKMRELAPHFEIDKDLRKKYNGKLFLVIFQQTADGKMRGGSKSQFDGDIILFTETFPDYRENYVYPDKNRYNKWPATELQYSIYEQRMLTTAPEVPALPAHYEPTESEELNFEVL